jgi:hypothetical protein
VDWQYFQSLDRATWREGVHFDSLTECCFGEWGIDDVQRIWTALWLWSLRLPGSLVAQGPCWKGILMFQDRILTLAVSTNAKSSFSEALKA